MKKYIIAILSGLLICSQVQAQPAVKIHPQSGAEKSVFDADIEKLDQGIIRVASMLNMTAGTLAREHVAVWSLPDDRLIALLNANVQRTLAIAAAKDKAATEINSLLNQLNIKEFTNRAPVGLGREDVKYDPEAKKFVIVPKEDPVPPTE